MEKPELLFEHEAAKYIAMSESFLRVGRARGVVGNRTPAPPFLKIGRAIRYDRRDLDAWLADRRCKAAGVRADDALDELRERAAKSAPKHTPAQQSPVSTTRATSPTPRDGAT